MTGRLTLKRVFLPLALAAPLVSALHERSGNLAPAILALAACAVVILLCAVFFPDRVLPRPARGAESRTVGAGRTLSGPGGGGIGRMRERTLIFAPGEATSEP